MEIGIRWRASSRVSVLSVSAGRMLAGSLMKDTPHRRDGDFFFVAAMKSDQRTCLVILFMHSLFKILSSKSWDGALAV